MAGVGTASNPILITGGMPGPRRLLSVRAPRPSAPGAARRALEPQPSRGEARCPGRRDDALAWNRERSPRWRLRAKAANWLGPTRASRRLGRPSSPWVQIPLPPQLRGVFPPLSRTPSTGAGRQGRGECIGPWSQSKHRAPVARINKLEALVRLSIS